MKTRFQEDQERIRRLMAELADSQRRFDALLAVCAYASRELKGLRAISAEMARAALERAITEGVTPLPETPLSEPPVRVGVRLAPSVICGSPGDTSAQNSEWGYRQRERLERAREHGD